MTKWVRAKSGSNEFNFQRKSLDIAACVEFHFMIFFYRYDRIWTNGVYFMMIALYPQAKTPMGFFLV